MTDSPPSTEIISIGDELLLGNIVDSNSAHIARAMHDVGMRVRHGQIVGDDEDEIAAVVSLALSRAELVITTGGLGPTVDDKTRTGVAQAVGCELEFRPELLAQIEARFSRWGRRMSENNQRQAYVPSGAIAIENPVGTAPIFIVVQESRRVVCLPGVPREMTHLLETEILPYVKKQFTLNSVFLTRVLHVAGLGESVIDARVGELEHLDNPVVGLAAHAGVVDIRITAQAETEAAAKELIAPVEEKARKKLGDAIYGSDGEALAGAALRILRQDGRAVAVRESGTRGWLAGKLAEADNGRNTFRGGELIASLPPGSDLEAQASRLARECLDWHGADLGLAVLIVSQDGQIEVALAVADGRAGRESTVQRGFGGHPEYAREWSSNVCLDLLRLWDPAQARLFR